MSVRRFKLHGRVPINALLPVVRDLQDDILAPLTPEDRARFLDLSRRVIDGSTTS